MVTAILLQRRDGQDGDLAIIDLGGQGFAQPAWARHLFDWFIPYALWREIAREIEHQMHRIGRE